MHFGRKGGVLTRAVVLIAVLVVVWGAGGMLAVQARSRRQAADEARRTAERLKELADQLVAARAEGPGIQVQQMSRAEADSWAYWETVARKSGISAERLSIDPEFDEPEGEEPILLSTTVEIDPVPLEQVLSFLYHMTEERPYVGISSARAVRQRNERWEATVEAFLYFEESG
ncbi:MAG: hypothetical protein R6X33_02790 [Candidatus Brocadiia bacterium]